MSTSNHPFLPRKPSWLRRRLPSGADFEKINDMIQKGRLHTVCQEAKCPNIWECFSHQTATFLILGNRCTRNCRFCAVAHGPGEPVDPDEPARLATAVSEMKLKYVVVTSVTRDDLPDGGAAHFAATIRAIKRKVFDAQVEVLIPDFQGDQNALDTVLNAEPEVLNHNLETVPRLYKTARPEAVYERSLVLIQRVSTGKPNIPPKSGLMLGLGETESEILETLSDLRKAGCRFLTLGQYLQPSKNHLPVDRYVHPEEFDTWEKAAREMGFERVASGPFVRSSYHAADLYRHTKGIHAI
ncbi:MAG: lipoyl synthase [Desulfobacterales bacterium]|nr:lipoyl synthase [Desulfobacterales bacterium]